MRFFEAVGCVRMNPLVQPLLQIEKGKTLAKNSDKPHTVLADILVLYLFKIIKAFCIVCIKRSNLCQNILSCNLPLSNCYTLLAGRFGMFRCLVHSNPVRELGFLDAPRMLTC